MKNHLKVCNGLQTCMEFPDVYKTKGREGHGKVQGVKHEHFTTESLLSIQREKLRIDKSANN